MKAPSSITSSVVFRWVNVFTHIFISAVHHSEATYFPWVFFQLLLLKGLSNVDKRHQLLVQDNHIINILSVGGSKSLTQSPACGLYLYPCSLTFHPPSQLPVLQISSSNVRCEDSNLAEISSPASTAAYSQTLWFCLSY